MTGAAYLMHSKLMTHTLMWTGTDIILLSITPLNVSKDITGTGSSERLRKTEERLSRELKHNLLRLISRTTAICELSKPIALNSRTQNHANTAEPRRSVQRHAACSISPQLDCAALPNRRQIDLRWTLVRLNTALPPSRNDGHWDMFMKLTLGSGQRSVCVCNDTPFVCLFPFPILIHTAYGICKWSGPKKCLNAVH